MNDLLTKIPTVPGVYHEPRPRAPEAPLARTDVAGFIGFEPRISNGTIASRLIPRNGDPPGHAFYVDLSGFCTKIGDRRSWIPQVRNLLLSEDPESTPIHDGQAIVYSLIAALNADNSIRLHVAPGEAAARGVEQAAADEEIESRVACITDGTTPSGLNGGHRFNIDISRFHVQLADTVYCISERIDFPLSTGSDPAQVPVSDGESIVYSLIAMERDGAAHLAAVKGAARTAGVEQPPKDDEIQRQLRACSGAGQWSRIADVHVHRTDGAVNVSVRKPAWLKLADIHVARSGMAVYVTIVPALPPARLEDWQDFLLYFGTPPQDGTFLAPAVRSFFANGGRRCWVVTVRRPDFTDSSGLEQALDAMVGIRGSSMAEATGLERLLLISEVSLVDVPDLHAMHTAQTPEPFELPPIEEEGCFIACENMHGPASIVARGRSKGFDPLFSEADVKDAQIRMLYRCIHEHWRVFLLLNIPREFDPEKGRYRAPNPEKALQWRAHFAALGEDPHKMSCAGLYYPWLLTQEHVDAPVVEMPPTSFVAGIMAKRDLARGPHISPANETVRGVVGLTRPIGDKLNGELYQPPVNINILRPFPGYGIQVWGARTLSSDNWLRYVSVRRCLSAIERRAVLALEPLVFEPNTPMLWLLATQLLLDILLPVFESGALRGKRPEEAFYIRCDAGVNPPEQIEKGILICEVGVAIAAPAEFIVFRLGRREGVIEVVE